MKTKINLGNIEFNGIKLSNISLDLHDYWLVNKK